MRRIWIVILLCAARGPSSEPQVRLDHPADKAAIQALLDAHGAAWTKCDAAAAAAVMAEDADWVSGSEAVYGGAQPLKPCIRRELAGMGKGSRHSHPGTPKTRFIRPDVAILDGDSSMAGLHDGHGISSHYVAVYGGDGEGERTVMVAAFRLWPQLKSSINPAEVR